MFSSGQLMSVSVGALMAGRTWSHVVTLSHIWSHKIIWSLLVTAGHTSSGHFWSLLVPAGHTT